MGVGEFGTGCKSGTGFLFGMMEIFLNLVVMVAQIVNILKTSELYNLKW